MPSAVQIQRAIAGVHDQQTFVQNLLIDTLAWHIPGGPEKIEDISFDWTQEELGASDLDNHLVDGQIFQIQSMIENQPWAIFILEFQNREVFTTGRGLTGPLRKVLRGLVAKRRGNPNRRTWNRENLLFICTHNYEYFRFAYFKAPEEKAHAAPLTTFGWEPDTPARTACEHNLVHLTWPDEPEDSDKWLAHWAKAFDVEAVTKKFYDAYEKVFTDLQAELELPNDEDKKMFAQVLMNRLMFLRFVEIKGWLKLGDNNPKEYLKKLYEAGRLNNLSWYRSRLQVLFFEGLAVPNHNREDIIGSVPYLNGGLFTITEWDERAGDIPDEAFEPILGEDGLLYRYNFTVEESTPLDIDVAVDPEMLGKVFEKLVTARRQSGSYYTPRTVVQFMCKESLKGYLGSEWSVLIDEYNNDNITVPQATELLSKLSELKVVDPACGSGAYLLGMLQELYTITELLDSRAEQTTPRDAYHRKLQIIQNNIYGVDLDEFAVGIARLRLWLSLAVDYVGEAPEPLPNLDYKIETGDSLLCYGYRPTGLDNIEQLKKKFFDETNNEEKRKLKAIIDETIQSQFVSSEKALGYRINFDYQINFSEIWHNRDGFDIVIANPPYGIKVDNAVRNQYFNQRSDNERGQSKDSYGIFMARGLQLLKPDGIMSYIVSETWRTIKSHRPLRKRLLETTTAFHVLDLPSWIFDATVNTGIITLRKAKVPQEHKLIAGDLRGIEQDDWKTLSDNLIAVAGHGPDIQTINCARYTYNQTLISSYENLPFFVGLPNLYQLMNNDQFQKLDDIADVKQGLATADNEFYIRKRPEARGSYEILDENLLITDEQILNLTDDEKENGVNPDDYDGRHFLPYDKGGASDAEEGWLPNYYVPTEYFLDWSKEAVNRLRTATIADVKRRKGKEDEIKEGDEDRIASRFQNSQFYFSDGLTFSPTGFYAPTFRTLSPTPFDKEGSAIISNANSFLLLGILNSLLSRYFDKQFINHTVHAMQGDISEMPINNFVNDITHKIELLVNSIIENQKKDLKYLYYLHEQKEIDALVYELYGLDDNDVREVELWYCRRYPRLAEAQGILAEVQEKYADHLARCQRILEQPPSYWRSNPILQLISQGESQTLEFKETLQYNIHTRNVDNDVLHSSLKSIAAFMNGDGGTLIIGVSDDGQIKGLERDIRSLGRNANNDQFELKIRNCISGRNSRFNPAATGNVDISFEELQEGAICRIDVQPLPNSAVLHFDNDVYIRDGNRTIKLEGPDLTDWIKRRTES